MKKSTIAILTLTLTLGLASSAFAWSHGAGHTGGHRASEHGGYAQSDRNIPYAQHGGSHETAADNRAVHEAEMKDPTHMDAADYAAPHRRSSACDGMTGVHGRHLDD